MYIIIKDNVKIGFFISKVDRDLAFDRYVLPRSNNCMKSEVRQ